MAFTPCAIVPSYNHYLHIGEVIEGLKAARLPVFIIDDGSAEPARSKLAAFHDPAAGITLHRLPQNGGKGAAVMEGFRLAAAAGFTHALQIDADGQHDRTSLPALIEMARHNPEALISGAPQYDETIPKSRKIARWITHVWVWIETLSFEITDSMCGYRVYPLNATCAVMAEERVGHHMDFDTEIMVRLFWRGTPVKMLPIRVTYPPDNSSNFRLFLDNWRITKMHTRLVLAMLFRFPSILRARWRPRTQKSTHWAEMEERGMALGIRFLFALYRIAGKRLCWIALQPILFYFFLTGREQRAAARDYWRRLYADEGRPQGVSRKTLWRHYQSFGRMALDKLAAWLGDIPFEALIFDDPATFEAAAARAEGLVIFTSHLGNVEISRALARRRGDRRVTIFAHTHNAMRFNRLLAHYNPASAVDVMEVEEIGPATLIDLQERLARGDWIVIAGDRIPVTGERRICKMEFLGAEAPFSEGPVLVASLLKCPVYVLNCLREGEKYRIFFEKISDKVTLSRKARHEDVKAVLGEYIRILEEICHRYPDQWYNFYRFWDMPENRDRQQKNRQHK